MKHKIKCPTVYRDEVYYGYNLADKFGEFRNYLTARRKDTELYKKACTKIKETPSIESLVTEDCFEVVVDKRQLPREIKETWLGEVYSVIAEGLEEFLSDGYTIIHTTDESLLREVDEIVPRLKLEEQTGTMHCCIPHLVAVSDKTGFKSAYIFTGRKHWEKLTDSEKTGIYELLDKHIAEK